MTRIRALLFLLLSAPAAAGIWGSASLRDHGHTAPGDGGALTNPAVTNINATNQVSAPTVIGTSVSSAPVFQAGDGSASAPAYSFNADLNTGMYRSGTDSIKFVAGGTNVLRIEDGVASIETGSIFQTNSGTAGAPALTPKASASTGFEFSSGVGISVSGVNIARFTGSAATLAVPITSNVSFASATYVLAISTGPQAIANGTQTALRFVSESFDDLAEWNGVDTFVALNAGKYFVSACVVYAASATGLRGLIIGSLSTGTSIRNVQSPHATSDIPICLSGVVVMAAGEQMQVSTAQTSGGALNTAVTGTILAGATAGRTEIMIARIY